METKQHGTKRLTGQWRNQRGNQKVPQAKWKWNTTLQKAMGCSKSSSKKEAHSLIGFTQETIKISNNLPPKGIRKRRKTKPKVSRKKRNNSDQRENK